MWHVIIASRHLASPGHRGAASKIKAILWLDFVLVLGVFCSATAAWQRNPASMEILRKLPYVECSCLVEGAGVAVRLPALGL